MTLRAQIHAASLPGQAPPPPPPAYLLLADLATEKSKNLRLCCHNTNLTARLSEALGEELPRECICCADDIEQLRGRLGELEQQILDLRQELQEQADELDASRAANRDLMRRHIPPSA